MAAQIEELKRNKVNVTQVIPQEKKDDHVIATIENESF